MIINPNCDIQLREGDIIYLIRPSPIHSRKLFMHRANSVRHAADSINTQQACAQMSDNNQQLGADLDCGFGNNLLKAHSNSLRQPATPMRRPPSADQQVYLKSCLSDGDFNEILIKVSEQDDGNHAHDSLAGSPDARLALSPSTGNNFDEADKTRRRSSCSDADDPKNLLNC